MLDHPDLEIEGRSYTYRHLIVDLSPLPLLRWLEAQTLYPKVYWQEKEDGVERAALGSLMTLSEIPAIGPHTPPHIRFFGGRQFGAAPMSPEWSPFPACAFWLPQFEVVQDKERTYLLIHFLGSEVDPGIMGKLCFEEREGFGVGTIEARHDFPSQQQWEQQIENALQQIAEGKLEKVVLARKTRFLADAPLSPFSLLAELKARAHQVTLFGFQLATASAFIGATPEQLYQREGLQLQADALAGTRPRACSEAENLQIQEELLSDSKEKREFACVKQFIQGVLEPLCSQMHWEPQDRVVPTTHVQHIHNRLSAVLKPHISDRELIETLHPTPALGGKPRREAMHFLSAQEPFHRGWYGAPVGWISAGQAKIAVAIRSALVRGQEIELFAGTGIVSGSRPLREWEELEQKITPFKQLFA